LSQAPEATEEPPISLVVAIRGVDAVNTTTAEEERHLHKIRITE
jgi:hypothetical protein